MSRQSKRVVRIFKISGGLFYIKGYPLQTCSGLADRTGRVFCNKHFLIFGDFFLDILAYDLAAFGLYFGSNRCAYFTESKRAVNLHREGCQPALGSGLA